MPRRLGQHFLARASVIHRILKALDLQPQDAVLEIGPGAGALTRPLAELAGCLLLVERDPLLAESILSRLKDPSRVRVRSADFLELPWDEVERELGMHFKVVSNLPYQAATAILVKLLRHAAPGTRMVLMFQKEVGDRLLAEPASKDYGSLTVFCRIHATVKSVMEVSPQAFRPPPKVQSRVVRLQIRERPLVEPSQIPLFESLVQAGFAHRRKMLRQNLRTYFQGESAEDIEARLERVAAKKTARAEEVSVEQWIRIFKNE